MHKLTNVLSVFDGISCGQIALERANISYNNYYASEIDKWAIQITQKNYPHTVQLGDIKNIKAKDLPKIDLLMGGSPCQGFSNAGKGLNFKDERSALFFEFVRLLNECKPKYWLLENVKMKKEWIAIINKYVGVQPIEINSSLVSAQSRKRLYWTNIPNIKRPMDKNISINDILETSVSSRYYLSKTAIKTLSKYNSQYKCIGKIPTLTTELAHSWGYNLLPKVIKEIGQNRRLTPVECERLQTIPDNYTKGISDTQRYKMLGNSWTVDVIAHILGFII
jgi:site-specific DNA-cytosine methylase